LELHLGVEDPFAPARKAHPALLVSDLEELRAALTEAGIEIILDTPQLEGQERFYAHDPFGNRLEFIRGQVSRGSSR
jgi:catechol 2,3-dioxygenase-like lactoylglutathione lyase family enzyme